MSLEQLNRLALAWGVEGGGSLIKGPHFFILKVFDLEGERGGRLVK